MLIRNGMIQRSLLCSFIYIQDILFDIKKLQIQKYFHHKNCFFFGPIFLFNNCNKVYFQLYRLMIDEEAVQPFKFIPARQCMKKSIIRYLIIDENITRMNMVQNKLQILHTRRQITKD